MRVVSFFIVKMVMMSMLAHTPIAHAQLTNEEKQTIVILLNSFADEETTIETVNIDLKSYIENSINYIEKDSNGYQVPENHEISSFNLAITSLLEGSFNSAQTLAAQINYEVIKVVDTGSNNNELYCLREIIEKGRGFYCIDPDASANHHIAAPHPLFDTNTNHEAVTLSRGTEAKFLSVSTTDRCANAEESTCDGTTSACGASGPFRISDMTHTSQSFFHEFAITIADDDSTSEYIQVHGCGDLSCPANGDMDDIVARISSGTEENLSESSLANQLTNTLQLSVDALIPGADVISCSQDDEDKQLCGTVNTQGRYINGEVNDPCEDSATVTNQSRFLHIEQNFDLREDDGLNDLITPQILIDALNSVL
jgi:hypothetical protein